MILGKIYGKITTNNFKFLVESETKKFEYLQVYHKVYGYVLCQVLELIREDEKIMAHCSVIGYKDENGLLKSIRIPFDPNTEVLYAEDDFIRDIIKLDEDDKGALIGKLEGRDINIHMDLNKLLTKHVAILAKSGAGKSYTVGVMLEEILKNKIPLIIIDPHGEYGELKFPNRDEEKKLALYDLKPEGYKNIIEYGDIKLNDNLRPLKLNDTLTTDELIHLMPSKPSGNQMGILYNAIKHLDKINFTNVLFELEKEENNAKWSLVNNIDYLNNLDLFVPKSFSYNELIQSGVCSIINLKGIDMYTQEIIVYKLMKDLFEFRKQNKIPPFFTVIEECHNYAPERSFGETKCSKIIRNIASEGRKFGMGLCVVSQRPARIDKSVLSQCTTQMILKVTNPNDLKSISNSVEGITSESENEIKNLAIGTTMVTGTTDSPLLVNVRPRKTKHGGDSVNMIEEQANFEKQMEDFTQQELLPVIKPKTTINDIKLMSDKDIIAVKEILIPGYLFLCKDNNVNYSLLIEMENGNVVTNIEEFDVKKIPEFHKLSKVEITVLRFAFKTKKFTVDDLIKKGANLDIEKVLDTLVNKGMLFKINDENYSLSENYIFNNLSKNACYEKINFAKINYNEKKEENIKLDNIKDRLSKLTNVQDQNQCFILKYEIFYN